jgi:hypothetical protein
VRVGATLARTFLPPLFFTVLSFFFPRDVYTNGGFRILRIRMVVLRIVLRVVLRVVLRSAVERTALGANVGQSLCALPYSMLRWRSLTLGVIQPFRYHMLPRGD